MSQTVGFHLSELVAALGGEWRGEDVQIKAVAPLETAGDGDIAFLANPKYRQQLAACRAAARGVEIHPLPGRPRTALRPGQ